MCCFTKQEFIHGLKKLNATTIKELNQRLLQIVGKLSSDIDLFKQLYRFTFNFGLDEGARILSLDMAISLWRLVYTIHKPPDNVLERWLNFLANESIRGIQKDAWQVKLPFSLSCLDWKVIFSAGCCSRLSQSHLILIRTTRTKLGNYTFYLKISKHLVRVTVFIVGRRYLMISWITRLIDLKNWSCKINSATRTTQTTIFHRLLTHMPIDIARTTRNIEFPFHSRQFLIS